MARAQPEHQLRSAVSALTRLLEGKTQATADVLLRTAAADTLGKIGPAARLAVPALVKALLRNPGSARESIAVALGQIAYGDKKAIRALKRILRDRDMIFDAGRDTSFRSSAPFDALARMGPEAIAVLADVLHTAHDSEAVHAAASALVENSSSAIPILIRALQDQTSSVATRKAALQALGELGDPEKMDYPGVRYPVAAWARGALGASARKEAVPALVHALKDQDSSVRWSAARALWRIGTDAKEAAPALMLALRQESGAVGEAAAIARVAARSLEDDAAEVIPVLARALRARDYWTRRGALEAIGETGSVPAEVVPPLIEALGRSLGEDAHLMKLGPLAQALAKTEPAAIPVVIRELGDGSSLARSRGAAAWVLGRTRPVSREVVAALVLALDAKDQHVCFSAANALGALGPAAEEAVGPLMRALGRVPGAADALVRIGSRAVPHLLEALRNGTAVARREATNALGRIRPVSPEALAALVFALEDDDRDLRSSVVCALGAIGPEGRGTAVPALARALEDTDPSVRRWAVGALAEFRTEAREALPALARALADPELRSRAAEILGKMGCEAEQALSCLTCALKAGGAGWEVTYAVGAIGGVGSVPDLIDSLRTMNCGPSSSFGDPVVGLLSEIASESAEARSILVRAVEDQSPSVRSGAIAAIGRLSVEDEECTAAVLRVLNDEDTSVRRAAVACLGRIGAERHAVAALVRALSDSDWQVVHTAAKALATRLGRASTSTDTEER
ncbi:MAG: HEAT repeat domain-containing protein [Candidatus Bipolaricaulota bacterium]|nr:HEAT repeat domain-containing protein [Candidatus Bipolaricaulota bacterium]